MPVQIIRPALCLAVALSMPAALLADENPSNPLSKGKNIDLRAQYFELRNDKELTDYFIDGAFMANDKLKVKYEAHYWDTDVTGKSEQDWESIHLKGIYFPKEGKFGNTPYRTAVGLEWIKSFDNADLGIGADSDLLSPFVGVALQMNENLTLIPLLQHYAEYSGDDISVTAGRLIGLYKFSGGYWGKLDAKLPYDWNDEEASSVVEVQIGRMFTPGFGLYLEGLAGIGDDRSYNWGAGLGLRFVY